MSGECMLLGSVSSQQRFGVTDVKALSMSQLFGLGQTVFVIGLRQISVTALFYLENRRKIHPRGMRACWPKDTKRREWGSAPHGKERARALAPPICFSSPGLPSVNGASQECCLFYLRSHSGPRAFLWPSSVLFSGLFPSLSFSHRHSGLLFPVLTT